MKKVNYEEHPESTVREAARRWRETNHQAYEYYQARDKTDDPVKKAEYHKSANTYARWASEHEQDVYDGIKEWKKSQ